MTYNIDIFPINLPLCNISYIAGQIGKRPEDRDLLLEALEDIIAIGYIDKDMIQKIERVKK